ncbi:hypothetical protein CHS0354_022577 [Potamilus streckersoni]|uniref:Uncharacterized protein n=1 Tax=Potamilus streckersoni TaxID=2493646 RepID=A0AAE0SI30_9BIVA|nr:hypothetical protein CHS0354_022577 [Potamilus streckersoni]
MAETAKQLSGNANLPESDLDYLSRPENYTGSNLQTMQLFFLSQKEDTSKIQEKKKKIKDAKYYFFHRYKHILKEIIFIDDLIEPEEESDEDDGEEKVEREEKEKETMESREDGTKITTPKQVLKNIPEEEEYQETADKKAGEDTKGTESSVASPDRVYSPEKGQTIAGVSLELESDMSVKSGGGTKQTMAIMKAKISSVAKDIQRKQVLARKISPFLKLFSASSALRLQ